MQDDGSVALTGQWPLRAGRRNCAHSIFLLDDAHLGLYGQWSFGHKHDGTLPQYVACLPDKLKGSDICLVRGFQTGPKGAFNIPPAADDVFGIGLSWLGRECGEATGHQTHLDREFPGLAAQWSQG